MLALSIKKRSISLLEQRFMQEASYNRFLEPEKENLLPLTIVIKSNLHHLKFYRTDFK